MTPDDREDERDDQLHELLGKWSAPLVPDGMDERILAAYRRRTGAGRPWWARLFTASVRVPLPVAIGVLVLLFVTAALALRPVVPPPTTGTASSPEPVRAARQGDVPVVSRTSLAGFQPVTEVTATVVTEGAETRP
jgi:hypothetical protein